jgi:hypothetical protein
VKRSTAVENPTLFDTTAYQRDDAAYHPDYLDDLDTDEGDWYERNDQQLESPPVARANDEREDCSVLDNQVRTDASMNPEQVMNAVIAEILKQPREIQLGVTARLVRLECEQQIRRFPKYWQDQILLQLCENLMGECSVLAETEQNRTDHCSVLAESEQNRTDHAHWVEEYAPGNRTSKYYRYCVKVDGKQINHHIKGGNVSSAIAQKNKDLVEAAIAAGKTPSEIRKLL